MEKVSRRWSRSRRRSEEETKKEEAEKEGYHWCLYGWECKLSIRREKKQPKTDAYSECMETLRMLNCFAGETLREPDGKGIK